MGENGKFYKENFKEDHKIKLKIDIMALLHLSRKK